MMQAMAPEGVRGPVIREAPDWSRATGPAVMAVTPPAMITWRLRCKTFDAPEDDAVNDWLDSHPGIELGEWRLESSEFLLLWYWERV